MIWSRIKRLVSPRLQPEAISNMEELVDPKRASRFNAFLVPCAYESEMDQLNRDFRAQAIGPEDYTREVARISKYYGR